MEDPRANHAVQHQFRWLGWRLTFYLVVMGLAMGLYGYDNYFAAPLMQLRLFIEKYQGPRASFTARNLDLLVPVPLVGAACGTFIAPPLLTHIGRKWTLVAAYICLCMPGSFLQLFAPNLGALVVGRAWNYVGIAILTVAAPMYLAEVVPTHIRGRAVGFCVAGVAAVGVISTTIVWGSAKLNDSRQYRVPLAVQAACPSLLAFLTLFCPESPVWDIQHGKLDRARQTLMSMRKHDLSVVEAELAMRQMAITTDIERCKAASFLAIFERDNLERTLTSGAIFCLNQTRVGDAFQVTIIISCTQFLGTLVGPSFVDRVGRRPVALIGFSLLFLLDVAAGGLATGGLTTPAQQKGLAAVLIIFGFVNAASFQSLGLLVPVEVPTLALREPTFGWAAFWQFVTAVITTFAVPQIMSPDAGNLSAKTAFVLAGCVFFTVVWTYFYLPETKDRTTAEVDEMYAIKLPMRRWKNYKSAVVHTVVEKGDRSRVSIDEGPTTEA